MKKLLFSFLLFTTTVFAAPASQQGMKIHDYPATTVVGSDDLFILDYWNGTRYSTNKNISYTNFVTQIVSNLNLAVGKLSISSNLNDVANKNLSRSNLLAETRYSKNLGDYPGADPSGILSSQTAIDALLSEFSDSGGIIQVGPGTFKGNWNLTHPNIILRGVGASVAGIFGATVTNKLIAADTTIPLIRIGTNAMNVRGVTIEDLTIDGQGAGFGIKVDGGGFDISMDNVAMYNFKTNLWIQGGTVFPASVVECSRIWSIPATSVSNVRGRYINQVASYPVSYTTAINFSDCHFYGPNATGTNSYEMEVDSVEIKDVNSYTDATGGHAWKLSNTLGATSLPIVNGININLDTGNTTNIAIVGYENTRNYAGINGVNIQIAGVYQDLDGQIITNLPQSIKGILRRNTAVRDSLVILGGSTGNSLILQRDNINGKFPDIFFQNGAINIRPYTGASFKVTSSGGATNWLQVVESNGALALTGAGVLTNTILATDSNSQVVSAPATGTGSVVNSNQPSITSPILTGGSTTPVVVQSPSGQSVAAIRLVDQLNSKTNYIWNQNGALVMLPAGGNAFKITDSTGTTNWFQVNSNDGATFLAGASLGASKPFIYLDSNAQAKAGATGLGITNTTAGLLSNNIVAGANVTITAGASGQLTIASSGGGGSAPTGTMVSARNNFVAGTVPIATDTTGTNFDGSATITVTTTNTSFRGTVFVDNLVATNGITLGTGGTNLSVTGNVLANGGVFTNGFTGTTFDSQASGNILKMVDYKDFIYPHKIDGSGTTIVTNDYTSGFSGLVKYNGTSGTNSNYAFFRAGIVPLDLDTSVVMILKNLGFVVSGTATGSASFTIALFSPASSSVFTPSDFTACSTFITFTSGTLTSPVANDQFYFADVTLTGWAAGLTPGRPLIIAIARDGSDANNDDITLTGGTVFYGRTQ